MACAVAADFTGGNWAIKYNEATKRLSVGYSGRPIFDGVYAEAKVGADTVRSYEASAVGFGRYGVDDCFGEGSCYRITYTMPSGTELVQTFAFYDGLPYFVTSLEVTGNGTVESNYAVPMKSCDTAGFMPSGRQNRVLLSHGTTMGSYVTVQTRCWARQTLIPSRPSTMPIRARAWWPGP